MTRRAMWRRWLLVFFFGGLGISLLDRLHIAFGVLSQPDPWLLGQAWWVMPVFGLASVVMIASFHRIRAWAGPALRSRQLASAALSCLWIVLAYASTGPWARHKGLLAIALIVTWVVRVRNRTLVEIGFCIAVAVVGPLTEALFSMVGLFQYHVGDFLGVPLWLPLVYLHGALVGVDLEAYVYGDA